MELRYLEGEKVYVEDRWPMGDRESEWKNGDGTLQLVRHWEIISALNRLFDQAEETPNDLPEDLAGLFGLIKQVCTSYRSKFQAPIEIIDAKTVKFDDPQKIKRAKQAQLRQECQVKVISGLKVIRGGSEVPAAHKKIDDILSDDFRAFLISERGRMDHHAEWCWQQNQPKAEEV